jgi:hypothetical protein
MSKSSKSGQRSGKEPLKQSGATSQTAKAKDMRTKHAKREADKQAAKAARKRARRGSPPPSKE